MELNLYCLKGIINCVDCGAALKMDNPLTCSACERTYGLCQGRPVLMSKDICEPAKDDCCYRYSIMATGTAGCRGSAMRGENGLLCRLRDEVTLADKMLALAKMPLKKNARMGKALQYHAETVFNEIIIFAAYQKAFS